MHEEGVPVARLMTSGVVTVGTETLVRDAARTLLEEGVGSLVVVDGADDPVGVFTTTDLAAFVSADEPGDDAVSAYMTPRLVTVDAANTIRDAAATMIREDVHHLPVTGDDGDVVGMLSTMDLAAYSAYTEGTDMI